MLIKVKLIKSTKLIIYQVSNLPFFLVSKNKPATIFIKHLSTVVKKHTDSIGTKGGSEIYFTTLDDLIILSKFIKIILKIQNLMKSN